MAVLEAALALIGVLALMFLTLAALATRAASSPPPAADLAALYRDGLQAAMRMQSVAYDLEQQLDAEALRHLGGES